MKADTNDNICQHFIATGKPLPASGKIKHKAEVIPILLYAEISENVVSTKNHQIHWWDRQGNGRVFSQAETWIMLHRRKEMYKLVGVPVPEIFEMEEQHSGLH